MLGCYGTSDRDTEGLLITMSVRLAAVLEKFGVNEHFRTFLTENYVRFTEIDPGH